MYCQCICLFVPGTLCTRPGHFNLNPRLHRRPRDLQSHQRVRQPWQVQLPLEFMSRGLHGGHVSLLPGSGRVFPSEVQRGCGNFGHSRWAMG